MRAHRNYTGHWPSLAIAHCLGSFTDARHFDRLVGAILEASCVGRKSAFLAPFTIAAQTKHTLVHFGVCPLQCLRCRQCILASSKLDIEWRIGCTYGEYATIDDVNFRAMI